MKPFTADNIRKAIGFIPELTQSETDSECAKMALARALARCEANKCQAMIRVMGMTLFKVRPSIKPHSGIKAKVRKAYNNKGIVKGY